MEISEERIQRLEELLATKSFGALTVEERIFVLQILESEEQYRVMQQVQHGLPLSGAAVIPGNNLLSDLKKQLAARHAPAWKAALVRPLPSYAFLLALVCSSILFFFLGKQRIPDSKTVLQVSRDTVYLAAKPDTVFVERVIYKPAPSTKKNIAPNYAVVNAAPANVATPNAGVNMKEKEELEVLLVSGS